MQTFELKFEKKKSKNQCFLNLVLDTAHNQIGETLCPFLLYLYIILFWQIVCLTILTNMEFVKTTLNIYNKTMKIKIKDKDLELHYSMRMYILYENIMGQSLTAENISTYTSMVVLFYSAIVATIKYNHIDTTVSYDEFMDWLDEQNGATIMKDFSDWFTSCLTNNISLQDDTVEEDDKKDKGKKSKN